MRFTTFTILCTAVFTFSGHAQKQAASVCSVAVIEDYLNLFQYQNFYLSGQPSLDALHWLRDQGVTRIINLRTESEIETFTEEAYNEEEVAKTMGFDYHNIEVYSSSDYTPEKLNEISEMLNQDEKIMIHCAGAGRVTNFFMAYLVRSNGYSIDEAIAVGKELKFTFRLEQILDAEFHMEIKDE